jgi:putative transposase
MEFASRREMMISTHAQFPKIREGRACELLGIALSSWRYKTQQQLVNEDLEAELRVLAVEKPRLGYRRLHVLFRSAREGSERSSEFNAKRIHRLNQKAGLCLRRKVRKHLSREGNALVPLSGPNLKSALDFIHKSAANGQKLHLLGMVGRFTRKCLTLVVGTALPGARLIRELAGVVAHRREPKRLRMDNGSKVSSRRSLAWCRENKNEMVHIQPGKPIQNEHDESSNGCLREEFLE